jgi:hypothetical protein
MSHDLDNIIQNPKYLDIKCSRALADSIMPDCRNSGFFKSKLEITKYTAGKVKNLFVDWKKDEKMFISDKLNNFSPYELIINDRHS